MNMQSTTAHPKTPKSATVADLAGHNTNPPEWLRIPAALQAFSVGRSWLYERIAAGDVLSRSIRQPGKVKGIRLINRDSLAAFIEGAGSGYEKAEDAKCPPALPSKEETGHKKYLESLI